MSISTARDEMRKLADEAKHIVSNKSLSLATKSAAIARLEAGMRSCSDEIAMHQKAQQYIGAGGSAFGDSGFVESGDFMTSTAVGGLSDRLRAYGAKSINAVNPFRVGAGTLAEMHHAVLAHKSFRAEIGAKASTTPADFQGDIPAQYVGSIPFAREPFRIASLFPNVGMPGPSIEYVRLTGTTNDAATVAAGGTKPNLGITHDNVTATAVKIAAVQDAVDETLVDFPAFSQIVQVELQRALTAVENTQILSGNGTAPNMQGILGLSNLLTEAMATAGDSNLDTLERAIEDLRTGSSYADPDAIVMNPKDWGAIRRAKASTSGVYLAVDPLNGQANTLWGCPVHVTTDMAQGTALVGAFAIGGQVAVREPLRLDTDFGRGGTGFTTNVTTFRAEERLALLIFRPTAFVKVTGLSAT